jgi:hypothetical protein
MTGDTPDAVAREVGRPVPAPGLSVRSTQPAGPKVPGQDTPP